MNSKIWGSAAIDFLITAATGYLIIPQDEDITLRMVITLLVGSLAATAKGLKTYHATSPQKIEVTRQ